MTERWTLIRKKINHQALIASNQLYSVSTGLISHLIGCLEIKLYEGIFRRIPRQIIWGVPSYIFEQIQKKMIDSRTNHARTYKKTSQTISNNLHKKTFSIKLFQTTLDGFQNGTRAEMKSLNEFAKEYF